MAEAAHEHFDQLLGTASARDTTLNLAALFGETHDLSDLEEPFTEQEIWAAIKRLPANKAPGPDGFTGEFMRACWSTIKHDVLDAFQQLYDLRGRGFHRLNQALLTLLPKKSDAKELRDYRPISLIHIVAKLFSKVLSLRLSPKLGTLVSNVQNAFISGRCLHDNFLLVRQTTRVLHQLKEPRVLLKLDLTRAFDSVAWPFIFEVLRAYGFGDKWCAWIAILLSSASTRILLNGEPGPPIWHRQGLRQGDPLSPMTFVLVVDVLGKLVSAATAAGVLAPLHPRRAIPRISMYADDVILFCRPTPEELIGTRETLRLFGRASGLITNHSKSSASTINCTEQDAEEVPRHFGCQVVQFPISYLGIPLTIRRPTHAQLQPMVHRLANRLPSWKSRLMAKPGRLALVTSVLSAIPVHQLLVKKMIKADDKIRRGFLWAEKDCATGG
jgi:hypothetical protein